MKKIIIFIVVLMGFIIQLSPAKVFSQEANENFQCAGFIKGRGDNQINGRVTLKPAKPGAAESQRPITKGSFIFDTWQYDWWRYRNGQNNSDNTLPVQVIRDIILSADGYTSKTIRLDEKSPCDGLGSVNTPLVLEKQAATATTYGCFSKQEWGKTGRCYQISASNDPADPIARYDGTDPAIAGETAESECSSDCGLFLQLQRSGVDGGGLYCKTPNEAGIPESEYNQHGQFRTLLKSGTERSCQDSADENTGQNPLDPGSEQKYKVEDDKCVQDAEGELTYQECVDGIGSKLSPSPVPNSPTPIPPPCKDFTNGRCNSFATGLTTFQTNPETIIPSLLGILLSLSGGIALLLIIRSGYIMMYSRGDPEKLNQTKEVLTSAIIGLLFIIFSLVILEVIGVDILRIPGFEK